ncbi:MAG: DUF86 domain-containing protein [Rectinemataceae bacterium]
MKRLAKVYLEDILDSINAIPTHLEGVKTIEAYRANPTVQRAVERELEIIGEAMNQLFDEYPDIVIPESRQIIGMRNRIVHGYASIDDSVLWSVATESMTGFRSTILALMERHKNA